MILWTEIIKPTKKNQFIEGLEIIFKELYTQDPFWNPNEEENNSDVDDNESTSSSDDEDFLL